MVYGVDSMNGDGKRTYVFDSNSERRVATYLHELNIYWRPQPHVLIIDRYGKERIVHPDLFLPDFGIYVEVCGSNKKEYYDKKKKMYCKNHIPIIFVETYKGEKKWKGYIVIKLREIQIQRQELLSRVTELQGYKQEILAAS